MSIRNRRHSRSRQRRLAQTADRAVSTPLGIIGFGGEQTPWSWIGLTPGEYNPDLRGRAALDTYRRMLTNDAQIRGIARILDVPIRAAKWRIEPSRDKTPLDLEIADFVEDNLFHGMAVTWDDVLRQMLGARMYGYSVLEKEFAELDGQVRLVGLWDRLQTTIERFVYDNNRVAGVVQYGTDVSGSTRTANISADRLVVTTFEGVGGNAAGSPLLRPMYMPWFVKHPLIKLIGIGLENSLVGTVWAKVPRSMTEEDRRNLRQAIEDLRVRDATGFVLDADVVLDILEGKRNPLDAMPLIEYCDSQMTKIALAQMQDLGTRQSGSGSRAVGDVQSIHFLQGENADADMIEANINRFVIPQLVSFNWPGYRNYPKLRHADILRVMNLQSVGDALNKIATGGLLNWTPDVENTIRDWYDMDPLPDGFQRPTPAAPAGQNAPTPAPADSDADAGETDPTAVAPAQNTERISSFLAAAPGAPGVSPVACGCGEHHGSLEFGDAAGRELSTMFDQLGDTFQTTAGQVLQGMIDHLQNASRPLLDKLAAEGPLARARVYPLLSRLELPRQHELRAAIRDYFAALVDAARAAAAEIQGRPAADLSPDLALFLDAQASALAEHLPAQLKAAFIQDVLSGTAAGVATSQLTADAAQAARDRANVDFRQAFTVAVTSLVDQLSGDLFAGCTAGPEDAAATSPQGGSNMT